MDNSTSTRHRETRKRSRSPYRHRDEGRDKKRSPSRSPHHHKHHHHQRHHRDRSPVKLQRLPLKSKHLHKRDLAEYRALVAEYLDLQKHLDIRDLSEDEVKGRWKSFVRKWNAGELAEGWYDPALKERADARAAGPQEEIAQKPQRVERKIRPAKKDTAGDDSSDDAYGPALPDQASRNPGPSIPSLQDLQYRQELTEEDKQAQLSSLRQSRKADRVEQKARLDELAPRAEAGTRERQLEKKREVAASNRSFAEAKEGGGMEEVGDGELMGGGDGDGVEGFKKRLKEQERKKSEREVRKEEVLRARAAEREERMLKARRKEEETMGVLREIARQRFGGGGA